MKSLLYILALVLGAFTSAQADTIDFWHVYHNKVKIREFNLNSNRKEVITLKASEIKKGDVITVRYYTDTPCADCLVFLGARDTNQLTAIYAESKGTGAALSLNLEELLAYKRSTGKDLFEVYHIEGIIHSGSEKNVLFRIRIEE